MRVIADNVTSTEGGAGGIARFDVIVGSIARGAVLDNQVASCANIDANIVSDNVIGLDAICAAGGTDAGWVSCAYYTHTVTLAGIAHHLAFARDHYAVAGIAAGCAVANRAAGACLDSTAAVADHGTLVKIAAAADNNAAAAVVWGKNTECIQHAINHKDTVAAVVGECYVLNMTAAIPIDNQTVSIIVTYVTAVDFKESVIRIDAVATVVTGQDLICV